MWATSKSFPPLIAVLHSPQYIIRESATEIIDQELLFVGTEDGKLSTLRSLITARSIRPPCIVFVQSVQRAQELFQEIDSANLYCAVLHSDLNKAERDATVRNFAAGEIWILIATDVMARGVDYRGVNLIIKSVFLFNSPNYFTKIYKSVTISLRVHSLIFTELVEPEGREDRVKPLQCLQPKTDLISKGSILPLWAIPQFDLDDGIYSIVNVMRASGCMVPEWMLNLRKPSQNAKKSLKRRPIQREAIQDAAMGRTLPELKKRLVTL